MHITLPLDRMTVAEKLRAIEDIWADLLRDEGKLPSPGWHGKKLSEREKALSENRDHFIALDRQ